MARLRKLVPDAALFRRRAAGEPLRQLAADYRVTHTALSRFFARPEAIRELRHAAALNEAEARAAQARWRAEQQAQRSRRKQPLALAVNPDPQPTVAGDEPQSAGPSTDSSHATARPPRARRPRTRRVEDDRYGYADWLNERDARTPAAPDRRVDLIDANGNRVASTSQSNAARQIAALEPRLGPLTIAPA